MALIRTIQTSPGLAWESLKPRLRKSKFRNSFKLGKKDLEYALEKGLGEIERHAAEFITDRLSPDQPKNDGKQTPFRGHPVFTAQHATATCCRGCLSKWHGIPAGRELSGEEIRYIIEMIMSWIKDNLQDEKRSQ